MHNQCNFIGRLAADPEKKSTPAGKTFCNFRIGVTERFGQKEQTEWISIVCWEKTAEFVSNYLKKGALVFVSGKMVTRSWDDKDGVKRHKTEIVGFTVQSLSGKSDGKPGSQEKAHQSSGNESVPF